MIKRNIAPVRDVIIENPSVFDNVANRGWLFTDVNGRLFVGVATPTSFAVPAFVGAEYLDLDFKPRWPLTPAPAGTSFTLTQE